jgi:hypothetical protein
MLKTVQEIIQENKQINDGTKERSSTAGLLKAITSDAKDFFTNLFTGIAGKISKNKFSVEVANQIVLPKVQQIDGSVSIKDAKALLIGLNEIIKGIKTINDTYSKSSKGLEKSLKPEKIDFSSLLKAINAIEIPEPLKEIIVRNPTPDTTKELVAIKKELTKLKLNPTINVETKEPKVVIDLEGVKSRLETIVGVLETKEDEPTGFSFTRNSEGNLSTLTEIYPNGKVKSEGWDLGSVKVSDDRRS